MCGLLRVPTDNRGTEKKKLKLKLSPRATTAMNANLIPPTPTPTPNPYPTRTIAFTTPENYATRLTSLILDRNWNPLSCPTITVSPTQSTHTSLLRHLTHHLSDYTAIAFTSRTGITSFSSALPSSPPPSSSPLILAALGNDAHLLTPHLISRLSSDPNRVTILVPPRSTPAGIVHSLGHGLGRKVLCPVPLVSGVQEPNVVPEFLDELRNAGWVAVRVDAYETRWAGPGCVGPMLEMGRVDGLVFTSSAEVEGLLKSLKEYGLVWEEFRMRWDGLVVAAHGPVTAAGAERLGVRVDVVSSKFSSFDGVVDALDHAFTFGVNLC